MVPASGSGLHLAASILEIVDKYRSRDSLKALLMDACPSNVGFHHGMARYVEEDLGRAVQILVCILHENELYFNHLFVKIDGDSSSPETYTGPIGEFYKIFVLKRTKM